MSGGSFNYLCHKDCDDIHHSLFDLQEMAHRLLELGYVDAAKETENLRLSIIAYQFRTAVKVDRLQQVWKAVEWYDSNDWGEESVAEAIEEYRKL